MSIRDRVKACKDRKTELVTVEDWGNEELLLKGLDNDGQAWMVEQLVGKAEDELTAAIVRNAPVIVRQGVFDPKTDELAFLEKDEEWLRGKSGHIIADLATKIFNLTRVLGSDDEVGAAKNGSSPDPES